MNYYFLPNLIEMSVHINAVEKMHHPIEYIDGILDTMLECDELYIHCCSIHFGEEGNEKDITGFADVNDLETWTSDRVVDAAAVKALVVSNVSN